MLDRLYENPWQAATFVLGTLLLISVVFLVTSGGDGEVEAGGTTTTTLPARSETSGSPSTTTDVGESGEAVNLVPLAEWVRIPPPPSASRTDARKWSG